MPHPPTHAIPRRLMPLLAVLAVALFACQRPGSAAAGGHAGPRHAGVPALPAPPLRQRADQQPGKDMGQYARAPRPDESRLVPDSAPRQSPAPAPPASSPPNALPLREPNLPLGDIRLRPGFDIALYAYPVPNARAMCLGPVDAQGRATVYVGSRDSGNVYALRDLDGNGRADEVLVVAKGLKWPVGVAYNKADGALYVSALSKIVKLPQIEAHLASPPAPEVVSSSFPGDDAHGWKFIAFGPDGKLYVPVGAPGNIVDKGDPYASIMRMNADGSGLEMWCRGVRNTVGFDWHPVTHELYFTDNGRDWLGDDWPPDELNVRPDGPTIPHYGYPYIQGGYIVDPDFGAGHRPADYTPPLQDLGAHVAALGMRFYTGGMFPPEYRNAIIIAEHGSWNRTAKNGYRLTMVRLDAQGQSRGYETFAAGWLQPGDKVWGRPDDVLVMPDGSLLVSDDQAGAVYRVTYKNEPS
jgi:glucose/arabinose dehydrogenase